MPLIITQEGTLQYIKVISKADAPRKIERLHIRHIHHRGEYEITYDKTKNRYWCDKCTVYIKPKNLMKHRRL